MGLGEPFSSISHMVAGALAIAGLVLLVVWADGALAIVSAAVYGVAMVALFTLSAVYHAFPQRSRAKPWLQRMDHVGIYLLIAGTYTPVTLITLGGGWGWSLFGVVWGLAILGITIKLTLTMAPRWVTVAAYIGLGWLAVIAMPVLWGALPGAGLAWLLAGGLLYTAGATIYLLNRERTVWGLNGHDVWHLFVMAGAAAHWVMVCWFVL